jgi:hypothetical protein
MVNETGLNRWNYKIFFSIQWIRFWRAFCRFVGINRCWNFVNTVDGSNNGVGKNALKCYQNCYGIVGAKTIGHGKDSTLGLLYNFIKGNNHDYIIEYNTETGVSEIVAQSSTVRV